MSIESEAAREATAEFLRRPLSSGASRTVLTSSQEACANRITKRLEELSLAAHEIEEELPRNIGKYDVIRCIGQGGQSKAWLAYDPDLDRRVVLKTCRGRAGWDGSDSLRWEGRALTRLTSPYIVRCYSIEYSDGKPFLVQEHVEGTNLAELMKYVQFSVVDSVHIIAKLAEALVEVHNAGMLHRDIKPSNIIIGKDGTPKLIDFGLVASVDVSASYGRQGTPGYMSPEQARQDGDVLDERADLFGLAAVLYELLAGEPIYFGRDKREILEKARRCQIERLTCRRPDLPLKLTSLVDRCLMPHPMHRPASAGEMSEGLSQSIVPARIGQGKIIAAIGLGLLGVTIGLALAILLARVGR